LSLNVQLTKAQGQLARREKLRLEAEENLKAIQRQCKEKNDYFAKENARRLKETNITNNAINTYNKIVSSIQARIASRTSANFSGAKSYQSKDINEVNVVNYSPTAHANIDKNQQERNKIAFF